MDPQFTVSREDLYHVQMDVKHVQAVQVNHADRILRLEKRQADDAALKSVWGAGSPFPSVLGGTPQQGWFTIRSFILYQQTNHCVAGPVPNASVDVFDDFDDEQSQNLLGNLQLEADEEPVRRGASRANSVRFDVSALQGSSWAGSRISGDFGPVRPHSGFGSHPMTERTLSHRSDGRHSSAGHSIHSGRASSLGLDTNFMIGGQDDDSPLDTPDPPPGLFILGSVPSIIRCWLTTSFSHNALLYAAVCTGSQKSVLDYSLAKDLGLADQIQRSPTGRHSIRLPVYLPEAVITQPSSRSNSPAPQLPALTVEFEINGLNSQRSKKGIRVFLGSDALRAHNADILFSQNLMTLYGDDRNKLSVPFVRPEDETLFMNLCTANMPPERNELKATAPSFTPTEPKTASETNTEKVSPSTNVVEKSVKIRSPDEEIEHTNEPTVKLESHIRERASSIKSSSATTNGNSSDSERIPEPDPSEMPSTDSKRDVTTKIWGSWRNGSTGAAENESTSGYQRAIRGGGRGMKVLKPSSISKPISNGPTPSNRSMSTTTRTGTSYEPPLPSRVSGETKRRSQTENVPLRWETQRKGSEDQKIPKMIATVPRSSNPIGGASAFAWMNSGKPKGTSAAGGD